MSQKRYREKPQEAYIRWWKGKLCRLAFQTGEFKRVKSVEWIGPPSGVYGSVRLHYEDGTESAVHAQGFRPTKKAVEVKEE